MVKRLKSGAGTAVKGPARAYVWARAGRTAYLVDARTVARALTALTAPARVRLIARLKANEAART